jgi:serine/threonine-protein kinase
VFGGTYPALIFADYMRNALRGKPVVGFPPPPSQPSVAMPDLIGKSKEEALGILRGLGFSVDVTGKGEAVVATSPKAGFRLGRGSEVAIELGKKPETTPTALILPASQGKRGVMPDVTGMFYPQAAAMLAAAGIGAEVRMVGTSESDQFGRVLRQDPRAGAKVGAGKTATLWVGRPEP